MEVKLEKFDGDGNIGWNEVVKLDIKVIVEAVKGICPIGEFPMVGSGEEVIGSKYLEGKEARKEEAIENSKL